MKDKFFYIKIVLVLCTFFILYLIIIHINKDNRKIQSKNMNLEDNVELNYYKTKITSEKTSLVLIFKNNQGIKKIIKPELEEINIMDEKKIVAIDYIVNNNENYVFKVENLSGNTIEKEINISLPGEIRTIEDLEEINLYLNEDYILMNDLDFKVRECYRTQEKYDYYNIDKDNDGVPDNNWATISPFSATFDGNGYTIKNIKGNAFLCMSSNATLKNTKFENIQASVVNGLDHSTNVRIEKVGVVSGDLSFSLGGRRAPFTNTALGGSCIYYVFKDCYTRKIDNSDFNFAGLHVCGTYDKCYSSGNAGKAMNHDDNGYYGTYNNCFCKSEYGYEPYSGLKGISDFTNVNTFVDAGWDFKSGNNDTEYTWEIINGYPELKIFADRERESEIEN